ncbi:YihY/virulence factor BrkB family protein [Novosphingobium panipatense]|uniref:YihY/virulence factor BrkB family protein n=1 Tax=Novosphingobium TaxID=165696 RepID=UPI001E347F9A|nr:YihY/virulence factor BrkB family protein [Novosphingobium sp. HII-3]
MPTMQNADASGARAATPVAIPAVGWKQILLRSWREAGNDNLGLIASGVAFCAILAMVPALGALVMTYGLVATPETVASNIGSLTAMMPEDAARLIGEQLANVVSTSDGKKGFGLIIALGIALYGVMKGASALITALNIAYDEEETRSFIRVNLLAFSIAVGSVLVAILAMIAIAAMAAVEAMFPAAPPFLTGLAKLASYLVVGIVGSGMAAGVYRYGPDRAHAKWKWLTPGSIFASLSWILITFGFGLYVANFGNYDATYGSLGAAMVLLTWLYLSAYTLLLGAELNCEIERQTARDTTTGPELPMGERGAYAADTVAAEVDGNRQASAS